MIHTRTRAALMAACGMSLMLSAPTAQAWGDEGHQVIALIAERYLQPAVRAKVTALLTSDTDPACARRRADQRQPTGAADAVGRVGGVCSATSNRTSEATPTVDPLGLRRQPALNGAPP